MKQIKFSILITTKNRLEDLKITILSILHLIERDDVECIVYDDASTDGTFQYVETNYPQIILWQNKRSLGLIYNRNVLFNKCNGKYAISLDDDLNFLIENPLEKIEDYFNQNSNCGLITFRIFWNKNEPQTIFTNQCPVKVKTYAGGAHCYKVDVWNIIPNYPEWFIFYGEEDFASYQLFKKRIEIHYVPDILVHHRVDLKSRKKDNDYVIRTRRSLRAGWYIFLMFYPLKVVPKILIYTLWIQVKNKTLKGDLKASFGIILALIDVILNLPKIIKGSNRLTIDEFNIYNRLEENKLYWTP
jgi:glycosyltransferase involved in cell wall biosynthesis